MLLFRKGGKELGGWMFVVRKAALEVNMGRIWGRDCLCKVHTEVMKSPAEMTFPAALLCAFLACVYV